MDASDWAGRICMDLEEEFGICNERALRVTTLVRMMVGEDGYDEVFGEHGSEQHQTHQELLIDELDISLKRQEGDNIEERWNSLMDSLDCQSRAEKGVYLIPWGEYDDDDWQNPGVSRTRPE